MGNNVIKQEESSSITVDDLIILIEKWGEERNFYNKEHGTTSEKQYLKLAEECGEIAGNLARGKDIKDDIGDVAVVLIGLAKLSGTSLKECLKIAYNDIKDRKGKMINGVFVKEQDIVVNHE